MWLKLIIPLVVAGVVGVTIACPMQFIEVQSHDGFKLSFPQWRSDEEIAQQLRLHDQTAETVLAARDPRGEALTLRGPEGLSFVYGPGYTREILIESLGRMYGSEIAERIVAGEFLRSPGPDERRLMWLMITAPDAARVAMETNLSYIMRKAYADALVKSEIARQEQIRKFVPPVRGSVGERIAEARMKVTRLPICRFLKSCGLLWW